MARIRTIKPEFFDDEKLASCSRDARLAFIGMISQSDDFGVVKGSDAWLRARIFPYDEVTNAEMRAWIEELEQIGIVRRFISDGETYLAIRNWQRHQKIDRPSTSRNPEMPETLWNQRFDEHSTSPRRVLDEPSTNQQRALDEPSLLDQDQDQDQGGDQDHFLPGAPAPAQLEEAPPPFISLPTNKQGIEYPVTRSQLAEYTELYPNVDVEQALRNMRGWLLSNRPKRKTIRGMPSFITSWLSREQDRPRSPHTLNGNAHAHTGKRSYCPTPESDLERRRIAGIA